MISNSCFCTILPNKHSYLKDPSPSSDEVTFDLEAHNIHLLKMKAFIQKF